MNDILLERLLTNIFTFGFELEGFTFDYGALADKLRDTFGPDGVMKDDCSLKLTDYDDTSILNSDEVFVYKNTDTNNQWEIANSDLWETYLDSTYVRSDDDYQEKITKFLKNEVNKKPVFVRTFEYASPVLDFIPANIKKIIDFFKENKGIHKLLFTNDTCGFHHHISWKGITGEDAAWILSQIAMDDDAIDLLTSMEHADDDGREYNFDFETEYSDRDDLIMLREGIKEFDFNKIANHLNTDKFSILNNHSNKTLEWRGPRNFLDTESIKDIKIFYSQLWKVISMISKELDKKEINGMSKENYLKALAKTNYNGKLKPLYNYPAFNLTGEHLLDDDTLALIINKIDENPHILLSLTNDKRICDQVIQKLFNKSKLRKIIEQLGDNVPQLIYNLAYKYIPAVMAYKADEDALYRTSEKTLRRLVEARYGFDTAKLPEIIEYVVPKIDKNLFSKENFDTSLIYTILDKTNYKIAKYFIDIVRPVDIKTIFGQMYNRVENKELVLDYYESMPESLKNQSEIKDLIMKLIYRYPGALKYIDEVTPYMIISLLGRGMANGDEDSVVSALLNSGKVSQKDIESARAYFTRYYKHSFNDEI